MVRQKKMLHPSDKFRKKQKKENLKRNKLLRKAQRAAILQRKTPNEIQTEIQKLCRIEQQVGILDDKSQARRRILGMAFKEAVKRKKDYEIEARRRSKQAPIVIKGMNKIFRSAGKKSEQKVRSVNKLLTHCGDEEEEEDDLDEDINGVNMDILKKHKKYDKSNNNNVDADLNDSGHDSDYYKPFDQDSSNTLLNEMFSKEEQKSMMFDESSIEPTEEELRLKKEEEERRKARERERKIREKDDDEDSSDDESDDDSEYELLDAPPGLAIPPGLELKPPPPPPLPQGVPLVNPLTIKKNDGSFVSLPPWHPSLPLPFRHPLMGSLASDVSQKFPMQMPPIPGKPFPPPQSYPVGNASQLRHPPIVKVDPLDPNCKIQSKANDHNVLPLQGPLMGPRMGPIMEPSPPVATSEPIVRKSASHSFIPTSLLVRNRLRPKPLIRRRLIKPKTSVKKSRSEIKEKGKEILKNSNDLSKEPKEHSPGSKEQTTKSEENQKESMNLGKASEAYEEFMKDIDRFDVDLSSMDG